MKAFALFLVAFLCASVYAQQVTVFTIDDFVEDSPALFIVATGTPITQSNFVLDSSIVGGERDLQLSSLTGKNQVLSASVSGGEYNSAAPKGATGLSLLQYDGVDGTVTLDPNGLADDFTVSGAFAFRTNITADLPTTVTFRVYSGNVNSFCEYDLAIPGNGQSKFYTLKYADFNETGNGCNFKNVGALEVQSELPDSVDITIAVIEVVANPSATPTRTRTRTPSPVPNSPSRTRTPTPTRTRTPSPIPNSPSNTRTPTRTRTPTPIPASPSRTRTPTPTRTRTPTPIPNSPSRTRTPTPTRTRTPTPIPDSPSRTRTPTPTRTRTPTPSRIPVSPSRTRTPTPTRTRTPTPSRIPASPSRTPSPSNCICTCPELECFMFKYGEYTFKGNQARNIENVEVQQVDEEGFDFLKFF